MVELVIPISEFLDRAINASTSSDYLAFMTIIARTADGAFLQNELLRDWESLDDLTADQILVLSPKSQGGAQDAIVRHSREAAGFINSSLTFGKHPTRKWEDEFWGRTKPSLPQEPAPFASLGGIHSPRRPQDEIDKKVAMTASVSETVRYFGIPESWLPCVAVLSLADRCVMIISVDQWFSLYALLRTALIDYEPTLKTIDKYKRRLAELPSEVRRTEEAIGSARSPLKTQQRAQAHVANSWSEQIVAAGRMLAAISEASPRCREFSDFLYRWLHDQADTPLDFDAQFESWFLPIASGAVTEVPEYLAQRAKARLPGTIQRKKAGYFATAAPIVATVQQLEEACASTVTKYREQIERLNREGLQLPTQIAEITKSNPISRSFLTTAEKEDYRPTNVSLTLPRPLYGWTTYHVAKAHSNIRNSPSQVEKYDVALSFAGEDRNVAREIANRLRSEGATVFFDEFERHRLWGLNLSDYLTTVYFERARFCMMIISESYVRKMWTGLERQAMQAGALMTKIEAILPVRIDASDVPGLLPTVGYLHYDHDGLDVIVSATLKRIRAPRT